MPFDAFDLWVAMISLSALTGLLWGARRESVERLD
jgi:hypothetical protein